MTSSDSSIILRPIVLSESISKPKAHIEFLKFTEWLDYILIIHIVTKAWQFRRMTNIISPDGSKIRKFPTEGLCLRIRISFISKLSLATTEEYKKNIGVYMRKILNCAVS